MKKLHALLLLAATAMAPLSAAAPAKPLDDDALRAYLDRMHGQPGMMNVPRADGEFLHDFILEHNYQRVLEVGTSNGYSALWMGMALRRTGGRLTTLEIDAARAALARENFRKAGLTQVIELREGDALKLIPTLEGPFDLVFIDAWKDDYLRYFQMVFPKVRPGGTIVAHNVISHGRDMQDFLQAVQNHPELDTRIDRRSSAGLSISLKRPQCSPVAVHRPFPDLKDVRLKEGERYKDTPIVAYTIKDNGEVADVKLERSSGVREIDRKVLDAVRRWKYNSRPGCPDVEATISLTIDFR